MRKNILSLSIAAMIGGLGFVGNASAITDVYANTSLNGVTATNLAVSQTNRGHMLVVPYYTTQNNNMTLLNIVNSDTQRGKAVKVRFRSALNSDDVYDFQLYLSAGDVWAAQISTNAAGVASLSTKDNSCTLPPIVNGAFKTDRLPATGAANLTKEGYVEIFAMADIPVTTSTGSISRAITHVSGTPACAGLLSDALDLGNDKTLAELNARGLTNPTTGLFANYTIVNIANTLAYSGEAYAIVAQDSSSVPAAAAVVWYPQTDGNPSQPVANNTADPLLTSGAITGAMFDFPDMSTPYTLASLSFGNATGPKQQAFDLSRAFATSMVANEFITDPTIVATTDFVFSMPTRRYNVAANYTAAASSRRVYTDYGLTLAQTNANFFDASNTTLDSADTNKICVTVGTNSRYYDRSETTTGTQFVISPGATQKVSLCGETSVMSFNTGSATTVSSLGASVARTDNTVAYTDGWAAIYTPGIANKGLPIIGKSFVKAYNPVAGAGVAANFGASYEHRYNR